MEKIEWTVTESGLGDVEKHPYVPEKKPNKDTSEAEKEIIHDYNSMRRILLKHGLMEEK